LFNILKDLKPSIKEIQHDALMRCAW